MTLRKKYIEDPIFVKNFWFCVGDREEFEKFIERKFGEQLDIGVGCNACNVTVEDTDKNHIPQTFFFVWLETPDIATLVHELYHYCHKAMRESGVKYSKGAEEVFAYYIKWAFKECNKFINGKKPKNKGR